MVSVAPLVREEVIYVDRRRTRLLLRVFPSWEEFYCILLPALSLGFALNLEVVENAITGEIFREFVRVLLPHMNEWPLS